MPPVETESEIERTGVPFGEPQAANRRRSFGVATREAFFARIVRQLRQRLPSELTGFSTRPVFHLMKIAFDNERIHYEVVVDVSRATIEIGLHFEDGPMSTLAYLRYFDERVLELKHELGHEIELERWTMSWGRIYELWPLVDLSPATADRVAARMARYIETLQPLVIAADVAPERSASPAQTFRPRWRGKPS